MKLVYTPEVWSILSGAVYQTASEHCEVAWTGLCRVHDNHLLVYEVYISPNQEASEAHVEFDHFIHEHMEKLIEQNREDEIENLRYFGHSHHMMGTTPSVTDRSFWKDAAQAVGGPIVVSIWSVTTAPKAWVAGLANVGWGFEEFVLNEIPISVQPANPEVALVCEGILKAKAEEARQRLTKSKVKGGVRYIPRSPVADYDPLGYDY